jgi:hypothetical protein
MPDLRGLLPSIKSPPFRSDFNALCSILPVQQNMGRLLSAISHFQAFPGLFCRLSRNKLALACPKIHHSGLSLLYFQRTVIDGVIKGQ